MTPRVPSPAFGARRASAPPVKPDIRGSGLLDRPSVQVAITVACLVLVVAPFWSAVVPPMTDVSQHILVARILGQFQNPGLHYPTYFSVRWTGAPTDLFYVLLTILQRWLGPFTDAKVYLSFWAVALWGSVLFLARAFSPSRAWISALLVLPLGFCWYVYMGFLPFVMALPLFATSLGIWYRPIRPMLKVPLLWFVLTMLFGFHVVGAAAAAATIGLDAVWQAVTGDRCGRRAVIEAVVAVLPVPLLILRFLTGANGPRVQISRFDLPRNVLDVLHYTGATLARPAFYVMLAWMAAVGIASLMALRARQIKLSPFAGAVLLGILAVLMPVSLGSLWPAGPRLLPFAIILAASAIACPVRWDRWIAPGIVGLLVTLSALTIQRSRVINRQFQDFLSGAPHVQLGAKVLPILADPSDGSVDISPFWSLAAGYTIMRGGANPYVFAQPYIKTGASPVQYRDHGKFPYAYLFNPAEPDSAYNGVSCCYDYVLLWGDDAGLERVLGSELHLVYVKGKLRLFHAG